MSLLRSIVLSMCALGLGIAGMSPDAGAQSTGTSVAVPGCSTAVAAAPSLSGVDTSFVSAPGEPFGIAIVHNNNYAFVASLTGSILEYSISSSIPHFDQVDTFGTPEPHQAPIGGASPAGLALTPNGQYLVAAAGSGAVIVNVRRLEKTGSSSSWTVGTLDSSGSGAIEAAVSPDGDFVFVSLEDSNELAVFNLKRALAQGFGQSDLIGTVPLGVAPVGIAISPNGRYLYVTSESSKAPSHGEGTLTTIDLKEAERTPAHSIISTVVAGCSPVRVVATKTSVFVTARESDALLEFSAHDLVSDPKASLQEDLQVGEAPVDLALVDNDHALVIADSDRFGTTGAHPDLAVVTLASQGNWILAGYVGSGDFPRDMSLSPNGKTLLISNFASSQLEAVKVSTLP